MTRSDLVTQLAEQFSQLTHRDTEFAVKTILDAMSDALARGHRIEIRGFGSFSINRRPPRMGRNPRSGEQVVIPEKLVPHFKPGKALREAVDAQVPVEGATPAAPSAVPAATPADDVLVISPEVVHRSAGRLTSLVTRVTTPSCRSCST